MRSRALLATTMLLLVACASTPRSDAAPAPESRFSDEERQKILAGSADQPMALVTNDSFEGDQFLRQKARIIDPLDPDLPHLLSRMRATVEQEKGVGIAAPQVGISRRIVWVQRLDREPGKPFESYLNPRIGAMSDDTVVDWEGCLSVPAGFGQVRRPAAIELTSATSDSATWETVTGFTARIFQHEIDHLDGTLFIDRKESGELMLEKEYREMRAREKAASQPACTPAS
ncbi:MAG: peptide deformylase [Pseudomonadota bacterium]